LPDSPKSAIIAALWRDKMHLEPRALAQSPRAVQRAFSHVMAPVELVQAFLARLPEGMLRMWQRSDGGHIVFTHQSSRYSRDAYPFRDRTLTAVCLIGLGDLASDRYVAMRPLLAFTDHLLGSADGCGARFSEGAGVTKGIADAAQRFCKIASLGYGKDRWGESNGAEYYCRSLWEFLMAPETLNTVDPLVHRLYSQTLMSEVWWRSHEQHAREDHYRQA